MHVFKPVKLLVLHHQLLLMKDNSIVRDAAGIKPQLCYTCCLENTAVLRVEWQQLTSDCPLHGQMKQSGLTGALS